MNDLEDVCVHHIRVMRNIVFTEAEERCKNCSGKDTYCEGYKSYKPNTQLNVRHGKIAYSIK